MEAGIKKKNANLWVGGNEETPGGGFWVGDQASIGSEVIGGDVGGKIPDAYEIDEDDVASDIELQVGEGEATMTFSDEGSSEGTGND